MTGPVRVAAIGCGLVAQRSHLPAHQASDEADLWGVAGWRADTARAAADRFGARRVYAAWEEAVADPRVEAVDICIPNALHAPIAGAASRAGKHVLVEKPMAVTLAEAGAMIEAARQAGVTLMVARNLRFVPVYEQVQRIVSDGTIGPPLTARGVFMHAGPDEFWGATSTWFWQAEQAGGGANDAGVVDCSRISGQSVTRFAVGYGAARFESTARCCPLIVRWIVRRTIPAPSKHTAAMANRQACTGSLHGPVYK